MTELCGLAVDASSSRLSIAASRGKRLEVVHFEPAREHTHRVFEHAGALLRTIGVDFSQLDFLALAHGPGSFTGVRIAAAAVQAIAFAHELPVCRLSSFAVLAAAAARSSDARLCGICVDARLGQAYVALYEAGATARPLLADCLADPATFVMQGSEPFVAVGDGWQAFPDMAARHRQRILSVYAQLLPSAGDLLSMALVEFRAGRHVSPHEALPEYLGQLPVRDPGRSRAVDNSKV